MLSPLPDDHPRQSLLLLDVPIGPMRVCDWDGELCVAFVDRFDHERIRRVVHMLKPGENPLIAVYGKQVLAGKAVQRLYDEQAQNRQASLASEKRDLHADFRRGLTRIYNKEDGRDAIANMLAGRERR